jgi:tetratricopeptide (TPR) repeat protein
LQWFSTKSHRGSSSILWYYIWCTVVFYAAAAYSQGFGGSIVSGKKKILLHRKLPAAIHLTAASFDVKATARDQAQADIAQAVSDLLETELLKNDKRLHVEKNSPGLLVTCTITHYEMPPPQSFTRNEVVLQKGHNVEEPKRFYKVTGVLEVAYKAQDTGSGQILDSDSLSAKFSNDFEEGSNQSADKSLGSKMVDPFKRAAGKKTEESSGPPTPLDLRRKLIHQVVSQITTRLVSTDEVVEVYLARGKLDGANKLADSGLWSRNLETLETMTPLPNSKDDAYRLYNIGVANEALGYQSEDRAAAKKFFEQAAINYGKAIDANPDEKLFLEPQNRIETAVAYYKKLEQPQNDTAQPSSGNVTTGGQPGKSAPSDSRPKTSSAAPSNESPTAKPPLNNAAKISKESTPALTNEKIIEMSQSGVDEESIIATIRQAVRVQFDISPDGQIQLAKNGVKGKILAAMRERAHRSKPATANQ